MGAYPAEERANHGDAGRAETWIVIVLFLALAGAIGAGLALSASRDKAKPRTRSTEAPTTTTLPPPKPYKVTDGVNVRAGPGASYARVGTVELGHEVLVACVIDGEKVEIPGASSDQWLRVTAGTVTGYVTSLYVDTHGDLVGQAKIPRCPGV
jgi:uncharacterized protein YgiM (DUF1202 family)